tara:strand:+ start:879 stop:1733 length:855 start_codon:yes stop_codon:yes gene_type:complete
VKNNILVVGGDSKIGMSLINHLDKSRYIVRSTTRNKNKVDKKHIYLDLEDITSFDINNYHYEIVIFCAAVTKGSDCYENRKRVELVNYLNSSKIIVDFANKGSFVIVFSTGQVFSGANKIETIESEPNPVSVYGKSKHLLEDSLKSYLDKMSIIRCSKVIFNKNELLYGWINDLKNNRTIYPFGDVFFAPISINYLLHILEKIISSKNNFGISHISSRGDITYEFAARYLCEKLKLNKKLIVPKSFKDSDVDYCPKYSLLKSSFEDLSQPNATDALDYFLFNFV